MLKSLMAVIAAAVGAGIIVALIPPPGEAVAARTPRPMLSLARVRKAQLEAMNGRYEN